MPATLLENRVTDTQGKDIKRTPLFDLHRRLGARMIPFAGYQMPVQYPSGIIAEHLHTRSAASLFDVSHMGMAILGGDDSAEALETLTPGDFRDLPVGRMRYTVLTNDAGGIIDDLMAIKGSHHMSLIANASRKDVDFAHIVQRLGGRCRLEVVEDRALIALQGPAAATVLARLAPPCRHLMFMSAERLTLADVPCYVSRSGYTGEDGFEISVPVEDAVSLAELILDEPEVEAAGLGARDTLRLEAGLCLYGNDIDQTTTPIEAGLSWTISMRRRAEGGFPGADVILRQIDEGVERKLVGLLPEGRAPARAHTPVTVPGEAGDEHVVGEVTSGGYGPSLGGPVAMGYVASRHAGIDTRVNLTVRSRPLPARVVRRPFVEHAYNKS